MDVRVRRLFGSVDVQTAQSQPIIGTPCDVPVPRKMTSILPSRKHGRRVSERKSSASDPACPSPSCRRGRLRYIRSRPRSLASRNRERADQRFTLVQFCTYKKKAPRLRGTPWNFLGRTGWTVSRRNAKSRGGLVIAHAAHAAATAARSRMRIFLLRDLGDDGLGREQ